MEAGKSSRAAAAALLLPDDLLVEILLRLPPEPIYLFRASFTCKHWRSLVHDARFLCRFHEFHGGTPPVLGFFNNQQWPPLFVPVSCGFTLSTTTVSHDDWWTLDCRHGRALLLICHQFGTLLVWDLMTGDKRYLPFPPVYEDDGHWNFNSAVLRAATDGDICHPHPFLAAFVFSNQEDFITSACVYSFETGVWGEITSIHVPHTLVELRPTTLVGNTLYRSSYSGVIVFDLDKHSLDLIEEVPYSYKQTIIMQTEDGLLGFARLEKFKLHLWSRVTGTDGVVSWTHRRVIDLERLLATEVVAVARMLLMKLIGYAEDADVIFIGVYPNIYMIHLKSMQIEKASAKGPCGYVFPYTSFYTPGITTGAGEDQSELTNGT